MKQGNALLLKGLLLADRWWWAFLLLCAGLSLMFSPMQNWIHGGEVKWV